MRKIMLLSLAMLTLVTSCKKHTIIEPEPNPIDLTMKVGNIYCSDGSIIDPYNYKNEGLTNAVGVIFWVNDSLDVEDKAYIVSRYDACLSKVKSIWSDSLVETGVSTSISAMDGAANTTKIISKQLKDGGNYQAKDLAVKYQDQYCKNWYLPSVAQLIELQKNKEAIDYALLCCEGQGFDEEIWYWTSTEDNDGVESKKYNAYIVSLTQGLIHAEYKRNSHAVRPVKTIK